MEKIRAVIVGYGNIGQYALEAVQAAKDFELVGVIRHGAQAQQPKELDGICVVDSVEKLPVKPQVALLCLPTRSVEEQAKQYLAQGINTVDSFDIHTKIWECAARWMPQPNSRERYRSSPQAGTPALIRWFALCWRPAHRTESPTPTLARA